MINKQLKITDVLIVGGGPGGLACALSLARGGRSLILCDDNRPRNKNVDHIRNLPGHEGIGPNDYRKMLKDGLKAYEEVSIKEYTVKSIVNEDGLFISYLSNDDKIISKRVVLAEGLEDILPDIPGIKELWGKYVFNCPYCHGYENVGQEFGLIGSNKKSIQLIRLLRGLTDNVNIFTDNQNLFSEEEMLEFRNSNMRIFAGKIKHLKISKEKLTGIILDNDEEVKISTLFVQGSVKPKSDLGLKLGCKISDEGVYEVDERGESTKQGVYCAGDVGTKNHSVIMATAIGSHVGICVNADLLKEAFRHLDCNHLF